MTLPIWLNCRIPCHVEDKPQNWLDTRRRGHKDARLRRRDSLGLMLQELAGYADKQSITSLKKLCTLCKATNVFLMAFLCTVFKNIKYVNLPLFSVGFLWLSRPKQLYLKCHELGAPVEYFIRKRTITTLLH